MAASVYDGNGSVIYELKEVNEENTTKKRKRADGYISNNKARSQARSKRRTGMAQKIGQIKLTTGDDVYVEYHHGQTKELKVHSTSLQLILQKKLMETQALNQPEIQFPAIPSSLLSPAPSAQDMSESPAPSAHETTESSTPSSLETTETPAPSTRQENPPIDFSTVDSILKDTSPSVQPTAATTLNNPDICQKCKKTYESSEDYKSDWLNCSSRKCDYWVHLICLGFKCKATDIGDDAKWFCPVHLQRHLQLSQKKLILG